MPCVQGVNDQSPLPWWYVNVLQLHLVYMSQALGQNGYPRRLIRKTALCTCQTTSQMPHAPQQPATSTLPYIQGLSHQKGSWQPQQQGLLSPTPDTLLSACQTKGPGTPRGMQRDSIENCVQDGNGSYVGQSKRSLAAWLKEHQQTVFTGGSNVIVSIGQAHCEHWSRSTLAKCQCTWLLSGLLPKVIFRVVVHLQEERHPQQSVDQSRLFMPGSLTT